MKIFIVLGVLVVAVTSSHSETDIQPRKDPNVLVVNGDDAARNQFPYQVSIQLEIEIKLFNITWYLHNCGGSIISQSWILTAAHCTSGYDLKKLRIVAGILNLDDSGIANQQAVGLSKVIIHSGYSGDQAVSKNDISLIKLATKLTYGDNVKNVALAAALQPKPGNATLSGWGLTASGLEILSHNTLQFADVKLLNISSCLTILENFKNGTSLFDSDGNLCSVPQPNNHQAPCNGDSGGPLTRNNTLIGIVSWIAKPCGTTGYPSVYVNVASYIPWILEQVLPN